MFQQNVLEPTGRYLENVLLPGTGFQSNEEYNRESSISLTPTSSGDTSFLKPITLSPDPGFCIKTKNDKNEKVFFNICTSPLLPLPKDITESELLNLIENEDAEIVDFKVPMSIGELHTELSHDQKPCAVYDIVIHPNFYSKIMDSEIYTGFFFSVMFEGVESKYNMNLSRDYARLKNKKCFGKIQDQFIRPTKLPLISELPAGNKKLEKAVSKSRIEAEIPHYTLVQDPPTGHPNFVVAEIKTPLIKTASGLILDVGEDRLLLTTRSGLYQLDIYVPFSIIQEDVTAEFNKSTSVLAVTLPVKEEC